MGRIRVDGPHKLVQVCTGVVFGGVSEQVGIVFFFFFFDNSTVTTVGGRGI